MRFDRRELAAIFAGGAVGALARVGVGELFPSAVASWPWAIFAINISGAADLIVDNMTVNLNAANSYVGPTFIQNGGVVNANVASALPTPTYSAVTITGATSRLNVVVDQTAASLTGNGLVDNAGAAASRELTLNAAAGSTTFSGVIQNTGAGTLSSASALPQKGQALSCWRT